MTIGPESQCASCVHYVSPFDRDEAGLNAGPTCAAFPEGISVQVFMNGLDHRQPIDGDHGVRWETDGDEFPEWAFQPDRLGVGGALTPPVIAFGTR